MSETPDSIMKTVLLRAPHPRVWSALSDAKQFGAWFGVQFDGPFVAGAAIVGRITPTQVDAEVAQTQAPYAGRRFELTVEAIEPMRRFAFRWHPFAIEPDADYSKEPTTLVEFVLADEPGGVRLTITESGFDHVPLARRAQAFAANEGGWAAQARLVEKYLAQER